MIYDAVIFDVDGVLVDVRRSFTAAAVDAAAAATDSRRFTEDDARQLKFIRGFNNDWHVAIAGAAWVCFCEGWSFPEFARELDRYGGGLKGLRHVVGSDLTTDFEAHLIRLAQEAYGGTTACRQLYGIKPATIRQPGRWQEEVPLLSAEDAGRIASRAGIVTGRSPAEMELAFRLLGWRLPAQQVAVSDDPARDKPDPGKLAAILEYLGSEKALLAGDGRDDLELAVNARASTGREVVFCFIGNSPAPWPNVGHSFPSVNEMLNHIEVIYDKSQTD
ncbi:MAG: hypothetical protein JSU77_04700 [Fidelibacterota bacterium]|nr:MAG: hypothetical protein JSU77_04700 [Candidatus Neomarinimicrobiota bacterium]